MWFKSRFAVWRDNIYLIPTVQIKVNEHRVFQMCEDITELAIEFHFLVFNARFVWTWERRNDG